VLVGDINKGHISLDFGQRRSYYFLSYIPSNSSDNCCYLDINIHNHFAYFSIKIMFSSTAKRFMQYVGKVKLKDIKDQAWFSSVKAYCENMEKEVYSC
jgi:hypothetical protein